MTNNRVEQRAEIKRILGLLESTLVPDSGLELFTVGDSFRSLVTKLESEFLELSEFPQVREYIFEAPFGGGKTHLLNYLSWVVDENASGDVVTTSFEMSHVFSRSDFEYQVVHAMKSGSAKSYGEVLRNSYNRIITNLGDEYLKRNVTIGSQDLNKLFETLIYFILGKVSAGALDKSVIELLGEVNPIAAVVRALTGKTVSALATQARLNSRQTHVDFVDSFLAVVKDRNAPLSRFDQACQVLAQETELSNAIFRILKLAGYRSIIIFVDEFETLKQLSVESQRQILTAIREFRDRFKLVGADRGYPSVALMVASTSEFSSGGELERLDPALHERWKRKKIPLPPLSESDVDNLLFRLRDLFYLAGYSLKPFQGGDVHEIIEMRRELFNKMKLSERHPRDLIAESIKMIKKDWIVK